MSFELVELFDRVRQRLVLRCRRRNRSGAGEQKSKMRKQKTAQNRLVDAQPARKKVSRFDETTY